MDKEHLVELEIKRLDILSRRHLAHILGVSLEKLVKICENSEAYYKPFDTAGRSRWFAKEPSKTRTIDNPQGDLKKIQQSIFRSLLRPICFPEHIFGGVCKRSVLDNAHYHANTSLLVTIDVRRCFPSITNLQVYRVWQNLLGCSPVVASLLTQLTTFKRRLPQGSPASPLLANLFIWLIDEPIRVACAARGVAYSTWIDDLAFSGARAREMIQIAANVLAKHGLRLSHKKIKIMGPRDIKLLTGTRLGRVRVRASKDKLARVRSGIHKLRMGLVSPDEQEQYVNGLIGQLRYIEQLCPKDSLRHARDLGCVKGVSMSPAAKRYIKANS